MTKVINLNGTQDSKPIRGYQVLNNNPANRTKAMASCVYNTMIAMSAGEHHANAVVSNGAGIMRR